MDSIPGVALDVWVDDSHHAPPVRRHLQLDAIRARRGQQTSTVRYARGTDQPKGFRAQRVPRYSDPRVSAPYNSAVARIRNGRRPRRKHSPIPDGRQLSGLEEGTSGMHTLSHAYRHRLETPSRSPTRGPNRADELKQCERNQPVEPPPHPAPPTPDQGNTAFGVEMTFQAEACETRGGSSYPEFSCIELELSCVLVSCDSETRARGG